MYITFIQNSEDKSSVISPKHQILRYRKWRKTPFRIKGRGRINIAEGAFLHISDTAQSCAALLLWQTAYCFCDAGRNPSWLRPAVPGGSMMNPISCSVLSTR